jgi:hypothetical protein
MVRGVSRAQAAAWPGVGNCDGSVPSSAMMTWAVRHEALLFRMEVKDLMALPP